MLNRRLNKKVALIGSGVVVLLLLAAIVVILQLSQDPQEFIRDAEAALKTAHEATDEQVKEQNYDKAARSFRAAFGRAKTDALREEVLFKMVDMYLETRDWPFILGCWDQIIKIDPTNVKARYGLLEYFYVMADSGGQGVWKQVHEQASEFLKRAEDADLLMEDTAKWDVSEIEQEGAGGQRLGPYLYLLRGRAALEMASLGAVTNRDESLEQAVKDLEKAQELEPSNIDAYWYLARAAITKGEFLTASGNFEERDKVSKQALAFLEQAVEVAGDNPRAHINLLSLKLMLAQKSSPEVLKKQIQSLEPEYLLLVGKFGTNGEAFAVVSQFYLACSVYSGPDQGSKHLDEAIKASEEAIRLDEGNVAYAIQAANLHYRKFSIYGQEPHINKAMEIAKKALTLPDAQDIPGPRHRANINSRFMLLAFLANCYTEQILEPFEPKTASENQVLLAGAEQAVHEIEQIFGSGEEPLVVKWKGMLELARGNEQAAIRMLYSAYEQLKAIKPPEPPWPRDPEFAQLSYTLAKVFKDTFEIGAVNEFLISALYSGIAEIKPESRLDYIDVLLKFGRWSDAIQNINAFEEYFGSNTRNQELRIKTYIGAKQFDEAEKELAKRPENDAGTIKLSLALTQARIRQIQLAIMQKKRQGDSGINLPQTKPGGQEPADSQSDVQQFMTKELDNYIQLEDELLEKLLPMDPNSVDQAFVVNVCKNYMAQGKTSQAGHLVNRYLEFFPDNAAVLVYKHLLSEPEPREVSQERLKEIEKQVLSDIADPVRRAVQLGIFYRRYNEPENATDRLKYALETGTSQGHSSDDPVFEQMRIAASHLFDMALETKDWELAEQVIETARREDLDGCQGQFLATRLAVTKGEFKEALVKVNECLKQKPVFSYAYMLRSNINAALENEYASMEDVRKAASLNPLDGTIIKGLAIALYSGNQKLGDNVSNTQVTEIRDALERAIALNPGDLELLGLYANYIAPTEPLRAVAIRQDLQKADPSIDNAILLGKLAMEVAVKETNSASKEALLDVAGLAFEQAMQINPRDRQMLYYYAEYYRAKGQGEKARQLLQESQDETLLWDHYFQAGQYEDAGKALEKVYKSGTKDSAILKGLLLVAEKTSDKEAVKKYSQELVNSENTVENNLAQIQSFLKVGLVKEAEYKLQSFKEKFPNEPRMLLLQAWLVMRQGQLEKALELTNKNLQNNPDNSAAWRLKGEINLFKEDYNSAISDLRKSKMLSDEPATRISLAKAYLQMERYEDAITELKNAIDAPGAPLEARSLLERIYLHLDRQQALKRFYEETLEKFPDSAQWLNQAGEFAVKINEFDKAEQLFKKAFLIRRELYLDQNKQNEIEDSLYATAFDGYLKALILSAGTPNTKNWDPEKLDKVFQECDKYKDGAFAPIAYLRMAQAKSALGDKTTAVDYCRKAVDKAGTNETLASEVLLRMYLIVGEEEVLKFCEQKLQNSPDSLAANFTMFNLAKIKGQYAKAVDYIDKCIKLTDLDSLQRVDYTTKKADMLILAYEKSSDKSYLTKAIADYESLLAKMPNNTRVTSVLNNLAYLLAENNERLPEALQYAKRALDGKPNNPGFLDTYAYVLFKNGRETQAAEFIAAALQQYSQDKMNIPPEVYEHKGMIKEKLGARDEALAAYRQALKVGADRLSQKARQRIEKAIERISP